MTATADRSKKRLETGLVLQDVSVTLGGETILEDVDLDLQVGRTVLLRGPNGSGKSTLLRAMVGLLPCHGEVTLFGEAPASLPGRASFAFVADVPALFEDLTVEEHGRFVSRAYDRSEAEDKIHGWLEAFELEDRETEFPGTHSRGMRHKLALALALGLEPRLLVLDEPFNTLDSDARETLTKALKARAKAGLLNVLSAHDAGIEVDLQAMVVELRGGSAKVARG